MSHRDCSRGSTVCAFCRKSARVIFFIRHAWAAGRERVIPIENPLVFSFLLVVRNEEAYIRNLLESVLNQDFPQDRYEVIVVDGESQDATPQIVEEFQRLIRVAFVICPIPKDTLATGLEPRYTALPRRVCVFGWTGTAKSLRTFCPAPIVLHSRCPMLPVWEVWWKPREPDFGER